MLHDNIAIEIFDCFVYKQPSGIKNNLPRDYCALAYRVDTKCQYTYSKKSIEAPKDSLVFVPDGIGYDTLSDTGRIYVIHFNCLNHSYRDIELLITDDTKLCKSFEKCIELWEQKEPGYRYRVSAEFYKILEYMAKKNAVSPEKSELCELCVKYINENFARQNLSIADVARYSSISEVYLRRIFNKRLGISPKEYLTKRRIKFAKYLIGTGYFTQKEIAQRCGFSDVKYFRYSFKKNTGMTIKDYKEAYKLKLAKSRE